MPSLSQNSETQFKLELKGERVAELSSKLGRNSKFNLCLL